MIRWLRRLLHHHQWEAIYGDGSQQFCMDTRCGKERPFPYDGLADLRKKLMEREEE